MTEWRSSGERRRIRLGPLGLVVEQTVPFALIADWLPHTEIDADEAPAAAISVSRDLRPAEPPGVPHLVSGRVRVWMTGGKDHAMAFTEDGHARVDLASRLARVDPGARERNAHELLTVTAALILARAGAATLNASAVIDPSGWCWLVLGGRSDRALLTRAFCADGGRYVSDGRALVRQQPLKPEQVVVESWHQPASDRDVGEIERRAGALAWEHWRPASLLRGILLAAHPHAGYHDAWRGADRASVIAQLSQALTVSGADGIADAMIGTLVDSCARRIAFHAPVNDGVDVAQARPVARLSRALEDYLM